MRRAEAYAGRWFALLACIWLGGCDDFCGNDIVAQLPSSDGKLEAVLFNRDCGASTGFSSQVSIRRTGEGLSGAGNAFVADSNHGAAEAGLWGGPMVVMEWTSPQSLMIRYANGSRIFKEERKVRGVAITYQAGNLP